MQENIDIISYVLYRNFSGSLFNCVFASKLKEVKITPVYKKEEKYLKKNTGRLVFY